MQESWQTAFLFLFTGISIVLGLWSFSIRRRTDKVQDGLVAGPKSAVSATLAKHIPDIVFFRGHSQFAKSVDSYWSDRQREIVPECIVRPRSEAEVAAAIGLINKEFQACSHNHADAPVFAIRGGGHSAMPGFSSTSGGIVIDLSLLNQVEPAEDLKSVWIGGGAHWGDVSRKLDPLGVAVAGGRNSDVGVGGLTLGGGYSFFSPRVGFVCDNVLQFRVVLASGRVVVASEKEHPDLWRSLKGGGNNFGVVTSFQMSAFPCSKVWGGFLYMFASKAPQAIRAFHDSVKKFDEYAAGPLVCITYVQKIGLRLLSTHVMYTKPEPWPAFWNNFKDIGRVWSTVKVRTLTSSTEELDSLSPAKFRHLHISTVVQNDITTLEYAYKVFEEKIRHIKNVKGITWTIVFQPVHSSTMRKGQHNVLGLSDRHDDLVVTLFSVVWEHASDDGIVNATARAGMNEIKKFAEDKGTSDAFCYLNWCPNDHNPFQSYGIENLQLMKKVSKEFDPDGLFQRGCVGGYKLPCNK